MPTPRPPPVENYVDSRFSEFRRKHKDDRKSPTTHYYHLHGPLFRGLPRPQAPINPQCGNRTRCVAAFDVVRKVLCRLFSSSLEEHPQVRTRCSKSPRLARFSYFRFEACSREIPFPHPRCCGSVFL